MKKQPFITLLAFLLFFGYGNDLLGQPVGSAEKVKVNVKLSGNVIPAGDTTAVAVVMNIEEGWHVNAHEPTLDYLIGTELNIDTLSGFTVLEMQYPKSEQFTFAFVKKPLDVYQGRAPIFVTLKTAPDLAPGSYTLTGNLRVQACNNNSCRPPSTLNISIPVKIVAANTGYKSINQKLFSQYEGESVTTGVSASLADNSIASMFSKRGVILAFLGIFLIGLALNLTPCVYPMLSVTVSLFGGQADKNNHIRKSFAMASVYVLGIVSMYSVLGVAAAYTGSLFGSWLQSPWVLAAIGLLIFALALSMFGLYELQPPQWMMQNLSGTQRVAGATGHFLSGLAVGIFAAPCIGPPVIALLAFVGAQGNPMFGFLTLFIMAFGLGVPYLILGTFSGLLDKLPKSGVWMVWIQKVFGVIMVGVALFYIGLALFPSHATYVIPAVLVAGGFYLALAKRARERTNILKYVKWTVGAASVIAGLLFIQNLTQPGIRWEKYSPKKLQQARTSSTPVMIDFYADWCIPCLKLDRVTFTDPEVITATSKFKKLKVDLTRYESKRSTQLRKQFDVIGVPTIVFIGPNGNEVEKARIVGFVNAEEFLERVKKVKQ